MDEKKEIFKRIEELKQEIATAQQNLSQSKQQAESIKTAILQRQGGIIELERQIRAFAKTETNKKKGKHKGIDK